jgi:hypothetical protein
MHPGASYSLAASGEWCDGRNKSGPDGYASNTRILRFLEWTRRTRDAQWFCLIGALDSAREDRFAIGPGIIYRPAHTGQLLCFANDTWVAYRNNRVR